MGWIALFSDCSMQCWTWSVIIPDQRSVFKERFACHVLLLCRKGQQLTGRRSGPEILFLCQQHSFDWLSHSVSRWMRFTTTSRWEFTSTWCWCGWSCWAMPRWAASSVSVSHACCFGELFERAAVLSGRGFRQKSRNQIWLTMMHSQLLSELKW